MKFKLKNLGALKQAEFELAPLTIICGRNNTGKTYATHATYGFLNYVHTAMEFRVDKKVMNDLSENGYAKISIDELLNQLDSIFAEASTNYSKTLHHIFAGNPKNFEQSSFCVELDNAPEIKKIDRSYSFGDHHTTGLSIISSKDLRELEVTYYTEDGSEGIPLPRLERVLQECIREAVTGIAFPKPFISSAERTGAAIFQRELDFTKNRFIEKLADKSEKFDPVSLIIHTFGGGYPMAVTHNVDSIRALPDRKHSVSFIAGEHPEILGDFSSLVGGEYIVTKDNEIKYLPSTGGNIKLSMVESSSAVRSLLDIGFYLRHIAQHGDLLMVDEPELNLHPENQRRVARLLAQLVNVGIKVFITTHSDYLIKELNTLILLKQDGERFKNIAKREKYTEGELLDHNKIRVYIAEKAKGQLEGGKNQTTFMTLTNATISQEQGIEVRSFDTTIDDMNRIQDEIIWGDDE